MKNISPGELESHLSKKFKVLKFIDLATIAESPSEAFLLFDQLAKPEFSPDERIVFYTGHAVGPRALTFLQYAADVFDISRCFVLVCCPVPLSIKNQYDIEFFKILVESHPLDDNQVIDVNTMCSMPFFNLEFMNDSSVKHCCFIQDQIGFAAGSADMHNLFNSEKSTKLRKQLLSGQRPGECNICWKNEFQGLGSLRQWRNKLHKKEFLTNWIDQPQIKSISLHPSIVCNFKCRICGPYSSSLWVDEELKYETDLARREKIVYSIDQSRWFEQDSPAVTGIIDLCSEVKYIDIYGGEPLLLKQFRTLLQKSIESGASNTQRLHFNTNVSKFPADLIEMMHHFKEVAISLSIDNIGKQFELERGGDWNNIEYHVDQFLSLDPAIFKVSTLTTVSNLNLLYLDQLVNWADSKNLDLTFNMLHYPEYLQFDRVTSQIRDLAVKQYQYHPNSYLKNIAQSLINKAPADVTEWVEKMQQMDYRRNQSILITHPELAKGMGYTNNTK